MTERYFTKKYFKLIIISIILICLFGYTGYEVKKVLYGPKLNINKPLNGDEVSNSLMEISGVAKNIKSITLNDRKIFVDEEGGIKEKILLSYGYNTITFKADDKFGRNTNKTIEVIYK